MHSIAPFLYKPVIFVVEPSHSFAINETGQTCPLCRDKNEWE